MWPEIPLQRKITLAPYLIVFVIAVLVADAAGVIHLSGDQPAAQASGSDAAAKAVRYALAQGGKPYRWGAEGPRSFDCSGLMWAARHKAGVSIARTAAGQLAG